MNSSTGFKRSLLRPPSGMLSNNREYLKVVDISQSLPVISSNIRTEVAAIQQTINVLDKDKRIRTGQSSLEKSYVLGLRKWLKQIDQNMEKENDAYKILKQMGAENLEVGFKKLWDILSCLDLIITKVTELQIVQLLKYDEMYSGIAEDTSNGQRILQAVSKGGFSPSTFQIPQVALEREIQLFEAISELKRGQGKSNMNSSKGMTLNSKVRDQTNQLIEQLRGQNSKLTQLLEELTFQKKNKQPQVVQKIVERVVQTPRTVGSSKQLFSDLQSKYTEELQNLNSRINLLNQQLVDSKVTISQLETKLKVSEDQLKSGDFVNSRSVAAGTYEQALLEEMNKMKRGFENRIQRILEDFAGKQKDMRKREYEYKTENQKIKWEKGLLLKKFESISN